MTTLTEFLLARIAADERDARESENYCPDTGPHVRWDSDRMLAECAANRQIVELHLGEWVSLINETVCDTCAGGGGFHASWPCNTLRALASVYADHPDYNPAWS
jgi:hypothetical protein